MLTPETATQLIILSKSNFRSIQKYENLINQRIFVF